MKFVLPLLLAAIVSPTAYGHASDLAADSRVLKEYGQRGASKVGITIYGEGVERPGIYFVERGTSLANLVVLAGPPKGDGRKLQILEDIDGGVRLHQFVYERNKRPSLPDYTFLKYDVVIFLPAEAKEKELNKALQPTPPSRRG